MNNEIHTFIGWLGLLGIPSIFAMTSWCVTSCIKFFKQLCVLQEAQKAQMRGQLLDKYHDIKARGFVWDDELTEWINQYKAYHQLQGDNQVLDTRKDELLQLPARVR